MSVDLGEQVHKMEVKGRKVKMSIWVSLCASRNALLIGVPRTRQAKNDLEQSRPLIIAELKESY